MVIKHLLHPMTYLPTSIHTAKSLKKTNRSSASQDIAVFYGTQTFIAVCIKARNLSLSSNRSIQFTPSHPLISTLMLSSHLHPGYPSGLFPSGFPTQSIYPTLLFSAGRWVGRAGPLPRAPTSRGCRKGGHRPTGHTLIRSTVAWCRRSQDN
jgi:hypothetical protein